MDPLHYIVPNLAPFPTNIPNLYAAPSAPQNQPATAQWTTVLNNRQRALPPHQTYLDNFLHSIPDPSLLQVHPSHPTSSLSIIADVMLPKPQEPTHGYPSNSDRLGIRAVPMDRKNPTTAHPLIPPPNA